MTPYLLAIDNGSQSTKVTIFDVRGRALAAASRRLRPYDTSVPGRAVHPGDDIWDSIAGACRDVMARFAGDPADIVAVGLCTIRFCRALLTAGGDLAEEVTALKGEPGGKDLIAWGGAAFAQSLSRHRLIDEYRLIVQPVALGDGLPLFAGLAAPFVLDLIEARAYADGAVLHIYRPAAG